MKLSRTKVQDLVTSLYGLRWVIKDSDVEKLIEHFQEHLPKMLRQNYVDVIIQHLKNEEPTGSDRQMRFHATKFLKGVLERYPELEPTFLEEIDLPPDKKWTRADIAEVFYGVRGDPKVYYKTFPDPEGDKYTTAEVQKIILDI